MRENVGKMADSGGGRREKGIWEKVGQNRAVSHQSGKNKGPQLRDELAGWLPGMAGRRMVVRTPRTEQGRIGRRTRRAEARTDPMASAETTYMGVEHLQDLE